jgi:glycerol-3-phosphate acyltransferase PlsY
MNVRQAVALAVGGYLIGSISFARLIDRTVAANEDLSQNTLNLPGVPRSSMAG